MRLALQPQAAGRRACCDVLTDAVSPPLLQDCSRPCGTGSWSRTPVAQGRPTSGHAAAAAPPRAVVRHCQSDRVAARIFIIESCEMILNKYFECLQWKTIIRWQLPSVSVI